MVRLHCEHCGHPLSATLSPLARYCDSKCRYAAYRERNPTKPYFKPKSKATREERECLICELPFMAKRADHRVCSRACHNENSKAKQRAARDARRQEKDDVRCAVCRVAFRPRDPGHILCSRQCKALRQRTDRCRTRGHRYRLKIVYWKPPRSLRYRKVVRVGPVCWLYSEKTRQNKGILLGSPARVFQSGPCAQCGEQFTSQLRNDKLRKYCSKRCEKAAHKRHKKFRGETRKFIPVLLADPCAYCGAPSAEIEHIVPRARGGEDTWDNLTGACPTCNSRKSAKSLLNFLLSAV